MFILYCVVFFIGYRFMMVPRPDDDRGPAWPALVAVAVIMSTILSVVMTATDVAHPWRALCLAALAAVALWINFILWRAVYFGAKVGGMIAGAIATTSMLWLGMAAAVTATITGLFGGWIAGAVGWANWIIYIWLISHIFVVYYKRVGRPDGGRVIWWRRILSCILAVLMALSLLLSGFSALASGSKKTPDFGGIKGWADNFEMPDFGGVKTWATNLIPKRQYANADGTAVTPEEISAAQKDVTVTPVTAEEVEELMLGKYNFSSVFLDSSLSVHDQDRILAAGFSDALTYPFHSDDQFAELQEEIWRNPIVGVGYARALKDEHLGDKTLGELNPWMGEMVAQGKKGLHTWLVWNQNDGARVMCVGPEYQRYAATLNTLLERFVRQGKHQIQTKKFLYLDAAVEDNKRRAEIGKNSDQQYTADVLLFSYLTKKDFLAYQEGGTGAGDLGYYPGLLTFGVNPHDKRIEFPGDKKEPTPTPKKDKNPTPTPKKDKNPTPTPKKDKNPTPTPAPGGGKKVSPTPTTPPPGGGDPPGETPKKDPNKAPKENTELNDDPGPGPNTNNGDGAKSSTEDQAENTDHGGDNGNAVQANGGDGGNATKSGGDANTPSYQPSTQNDWVDTQADGGGGGSEPIDNPSTEASYDAPTDGTNVTTDGGEGNFVFFDA